MAQNNILNKEFADESIIRSMLLPEYKGVKIRIVQQTDSTNEQMKKAALSGEGEISVLIAESQSAGRGTKGRSFYSPADTGCYMSILLRPTYTVGECTLLTTAAAAATAEAIEKLTGRKTGIKWVNDIIVDKRKVAGILTEGSIKKDLSGLDWAVVGIGVNIREPENGFPDEIKKIAGTLCGNGDEIKNCLIAEIINIFLNYYGRLTQKQFIEQYRKRLFFLGNEITVTQGENTYKATAVDIDSMCRLIVKDTEGNERVLNAGEISIRPV